jgi:hypothetical protein
MGGVNRPIPPNTVQTRSPAVPDSPLRCYFNKTPLFRKTAVRLQAIETQGPAASADAPISQNTLLIPLFPEFGNDFKGAIRPMQSFRGAAQRRTRNP